MTDRQPSSRDTSSEILTILRILCQGASACSPGRACGGLPEWQRQIRALAVRLRRTLDWQHQIVLEALRSLNTNDPDRIREQLPRLVTLGGFPHLDLDQYFVPHGLSQAEAEHLLGAFQTGGEDSQ